jgi:hypothetical protein
MTTLIDDVTVIGGVDTERFNRTMLEEWAYIRHHRAHTALKGQAPASRVTNLSGQYRCEAYVGQETTALPTERHYWPSRRPRGCISRHRLPVYLRTWPRTLRSPASCSSSHFRPSGRYSKADPCHPDRIWTSAKGVRAACRGLVCPYLLTL